MYLVRGTNDYEVATRPRPGFPIVLYDDMSSCSEANRFLRYYLTRADIRSSKSWEPTGQAIYDFFGFLQAHELSWDDVDRGEGKNLIGAYRDYCFEIHDLHRNTVRQRILYIKEFYEYAYRENWIKKLPFVYEHRIARFNSGFLAHLDASGGIKSVASVMPRRHKDLFKFLSKGQVESLLAVITNPHHRMIVLLALHSGLRREELASFPLSYVSDPNSKGKRSSNVGIILDPNDGSGIKTKGEKLRKIYISNRLMSELRHYAIHWRGERASLSVESHKALFLNQSGNPWSSDGKGLEVMVRNYGKKAGFRTHPHMLRHTYATHMLIALQRNRCYSGIEPIVFLKSQLGHASINTTMQYLHLANELADDAVLAYGDELDAFNTFAAELN